MEYARRERFEDLTKALLEEGLGLKAGSLGSTVPESEPLKGRQGQTEYRPRQRNARILESLLERQARHLGMAIR